MAVFVINETVCGATGRPVARCTCGGHGPTGNLDAAGVAHEATLRSVRSEDPHARRHALAALDATRAGDSDAAEKAHRRAAERHDALAEKSEEDGELGEAQLHRHAARRHRTAAALHAVAAPPADDNG